jgi:hypothetical protein
VKPYEPKQEREQKKSWALQRQVLTRLKDGPVPYDTLYVLFDPHLTADIHLTLQDLITCQYIELGMGRHPTVSITGGGIEQLESRKD